MNALEEFRKQLANDLEASSKLPSYVIDDNGEMKPIYPDGMVRAKTENVADISDVVFPKFNAFVKQEIKKYPSIAAFVIAVSTINTDTNSPEIVTFAAGNYHSIQIIINNFTNPLLKSGCLLFKN